MKKNKQTYKSALADDFKLYNRFKHLMSHHLRSQFFFTFSSIYTEHQTLSERINTYRRDGKVWTEKDYKLTANYKRNSSILSATKNLEQFKDRIKRVNYNLDTNPKLKNKLKKMSAMFVTVSPRSRSKDHETEADIRKALNDNNSTISKILKVTLYGRRIFTIISTVEFTGVATHDKKTGKPLDKIVMNTGMHSHVLVGYDVSDTLKRMKRKFPEKRITRHNLHSKLKDYIWNKISYVGIINTKKVETLIRNGELTEDFQEILKYTIKGSDLLSWDDNLMTNFLKVFDGKQVKLRRSTGVFRELFKSIPKEVSLSEPAPAELSDGTVIEYGEWSETSNLFKTAEGYATKDLKDLNLDTLENYVYNYKIFDGTYYKREHIRAERNVYIYENAHKTSELFVDLIKQYNETVSYWEDLIQKQKDAISIVETNNLEETKRYRMITPKWDRHEKEASYSMDMDPLEAMIYHDTNRDWIASRYEDEPYIIAEVDWGINWDIDLNTVVN